MTTRHFLLLTVFFMWGANPALAEKADKDKPMFIEADRLFVEGDRKIHTLEGHVVINKGTLQIKADRIMIEEDAKGFQKSTAQGGADGLSRFRQKPDNNENDIEGEAERIEYDTATDIVELFNRAYVKNGGDEIKGNYIRYDTLQGKYLVTGGGKNTASGGAARVHAVIQPRKK